MWLTKAKSNEDVFWNCINQMSLVRCRLYEENLGIYDNQKKMRFFPYGTESTADFLAISAALGDVFLRPYAALMRLSFSCGLIRHSKKEIADRKKFLDSMYIVFSTAYEEEPNAFSILYDPQKIKTDEVIAVFGEGCKARGKGMWIRLA